MLKSNIDSYLENWKTYLIISILPCFTFFVFGMLQMYLMNSAIFWFGLIDLIKISVPLFLFFLAIITIIGILLPSRSKSYYFAFVWGFGIGLYLQGNWMNNDYGLLDGTVIDWSRYQIRGIVSVIIFAITTLFAFMLVKFKKRVFYRASSHASVLILVMQLVLLSVLLLNNASPFISGNDYYLNDDGLFLLSTNENFIVFLVDALDAAYFNNSVVEKMPYSQLLFKDFTYFSNVLAAYTYTHPSIPHILTNNLYLNQTPYSEYLETAYANSALLNLLEEKGYSVGIYSYEGMIGKSKVINQMYGKPEINSITRFSYLYSKLTAFRYMPQFLKKYFVVYTGDFDMLKSTDHEEVYMIDDALFYAKLIDRSIVAVEETSVFRFYHLQGAHTPFTLDENAKRQLDTSREQQIYGCLTILNEYITQLKALEIYDNTTIIIMADHGSLGLYTNPVFLVKKAGASHEFIIDDTPVSYIDNLLPTLLYVSGLSDDIRNSFFAPDTSDSRIVYILGPRQIINGEIFNELHEYATDSHAGDSSSLHPTGNIFSRKEQHGYYYELGTILDATQFKNIDYFSFVGEKNIYSQYHSSMTFNIGHIPESDLLLTLDIRETRVWNNDISLFINQNYIATKSLQSYNGQMSFIIPHEYILNEFFTMSLYFHGLDEMYSNDRISQVIYPFSWNSLMIENIGMHDDYTECADRNTVRKMRLNPSILRYGEVLLNSHVILEKNNLAHGYYIQMPEGVYRVTIYGENLNDAFFNIAGKMIDGFEHGVDKIELDFSDDYRTFEFMLEDTYVSVDFVILNTGEDDIVFSHFMLEEVKQSIN